jgi:hypothetical protein
MSTGAYMKTRISPFFVGALMCFFPSFCSAEGPDVRPVIEVLNHVGVLLGASSSEKGWMKVESAGSQVAAAEYKVYSLSKFHAKVEGGAYHEEEHPCSGNIDLSTGLGREEEMIGIAGAWDAMPRRSEILSSDTEVYKKEVAEILRGRGLESAPVNIEKIIRIDLEGDGQDEVVIAASISNADESLVNAPSDYYSFVALRKIVGEEVETSILEGFFGAGKAFGGSLPMKYGITAVLDVNGDGKQEIVVKWRYYEGSGQSVFEVDDGAVSKAMAGGCGA